MSVLTAGFEGGSNGATILTGDAGDASAWDSIAIPATGALTYDNAHVATGVRAAKLAQGGTPGTLALGWTSSSFGTQTDHYGRFYIYATANPSSLFSLWWVNLVGALKARIYLNVNGLILLTDSTGGGLVSTVTPIGLNQWVRIEYHVVHSATVGQVELKLFSSPDSSFPTETIATAANANTGTGGDAVSLGFLGAATPANYTIWVDNFMAAAPSYPGPAAVPVGLETHAVRRGAF